MRDNWEVLCERYTATVILGKIVGVCVTFGNGPDHIQQVKEFAAANPESFLVAKTQLAQALERVGLADAWLLRIRNE
jgi:hypothetical protein